MARSSLLKLLGAFLTGLAIALASAVIYVRMSEKPATPVAEIAPPLPAELPQTSAPNEPVAPPAVTAPEAIPQISPEPASVSPKVASAASVPKARRSPPRPKVAHRSESEQPPVEVVQNTPGPLPAAAPSGYPPMSNPQSAAPAADAPAPPAESAAPAPPQPHVVQLSAGTQIAIRLGEALSTENNYRGDTFRGTLERPIIRDGFIIADKGSKVLGRVTDATPAGRVKGVSSLAVTLTEINTTDGQRIRVNTNAVEKSGPTSTGTDAAKIAGGAALGALIGALGGGGKGAAIGAGAGGAAGTGVVLATRGKSAKLPVESLLTFQLADPVTITEKLNH